MIEKKDRNNVKLNMPDTTNNNPDELTQKELMGMFENGSLKKEIILSEIDKKPESDFCYHLLGLIQKKEKDYENALNSFYKAKKINPNNSGTLNNIGEILFLTNKREEALSCFVGLTELNPEYVMGWINLAISYQNSGLLDKSEECYKKALSLDPLNKLANIGFCELLRTLGRNNEAVVILKDMSSNFPNAKIINTMYARSLFDDGKESEALEVFDKLANDFPSDKAVLHNQAVIQKIKKNYNESLKTALKLEEIDSASEMAKALILELYMRKKDIKGYINYYNSLEKNIKFNRTIDAMTNYIAYQTDEKIKPAFCSKPMDHIFKTKISDFSSSSKDLMKNLKSDIKDKYNVWEPNSNSTIGGYQTTKNLFLYKEESFSEMLKIIVSAVNKYKEHYNDSESFMIKEWPKNTSIHSWAVTLNTKGHQNAHIHPDGWLSGVFYLQVPKIKKDEGSIFFSSLGYDYPSLNKKKIVEKRIKPKQGDLILFPSSLFHGTIPTTSENDRISLAFDIKPIY